MAKDCTRCKHAIFNELWGEYKCKIVQHKVAPVNVVACSSYEKGEPTISKDDEVMEEE